MAKSNPQDNSRNRRFHVERLDGERVTLDTAEAHHAAHVLRLGVGAEVELFDGRGCTAPGVVEHVKRSDVIVCLTDAPMDTPRPTPRMHVGFAVPKGKRLDWLLEKATELGAATLTPVVFARSVAGPGEKKGKTPSAAVPDRWRAHCIAAAKQSGLNYLPDLAPAASLAEHLEAGAVGARLFGDAGVAPVCRETWPAVEAADVHLLIGPEGGLADDERAAALAAGWQPVCVGHTVLRVETAVVALLAVTAALSGPRKSVGPIRGDG